jgi:hypothetical protein
MLGYPAMQIGGEPKIVLCVRLAYRLIKVNQVADIAVTIHTPS